MTDTTETPATADGDTAPGTEPTQDDATAQDDTSTDADEVSTDDADKTAKANREAAKYRRRLRETEAERDGIAERLAVLQRSEAQRIAADHLADGADIWRDGATIDQLLDDDGNIDTDKVIQLAKATAAAHPHWTRPPQPKPIRRGELTSGATNTGDRSTPTWASVLRRTSG